jgi:hypothetical protein
MKGKEDAAMNPVIVTSQVGADGVLNLTVPLKPENANQTVRVTIETLPQPKSQEDWLKFIENTAGKITDPTFEGPPQGEPA